MKRIDLTQRSDWAAMPYGRLAPSAAYEVARSRLGLNILPHLKQARLGIQSIDGQDWLKFAVIFLHDRVQSLTLAFSRDILQDNGLDVFLEEVVARTPSLTSLIVLVETLTPISFFEQSLARTFPRFSALQSVQLSSYSLSPIVLSSLSRCDTITRIGISFGRTYTMRSMRSESLARNPRRFSRVGPLRNVRALTLQGQLVALHPVFQGGARMRSLVHLQIDMVWKDITAHFGPFLQDLITACPGLETLDFTRNEDNGLYSNSVPPDYAKIEACTLAPLAQLGGLKHFGVVFTRSVNLSNEDLLELVRSCKSLTALHLSSEPVYSGKSMLTMDVLAELARIRPNLEELSLFVHSGSDYVSPSAEERLENLKYLSFGISSIEDTDSAAEYLGRILTQKCTFSIERKIDAEAEEFLKKEDMEDIRDRRRKWAEVKKRLPTFVQLRTLEIENKNLRMQLSASRQN